MTVVRIFVLTVAMLGFLVVCGMKGKLVFVILGFFVPAFWVVGAIKIAKPRSWWARRYYGDVAMSDSEQHFVLSKRDRG